MAGDKTYGQYEAEYIRARDAVEYAARHGGIADVDAALDVFSKARDALAQAEEAKGRTHDGLLRP